MKIYKYILKLESIQQIELPVGYKILDFQIQRSNVRVGQHWQYLNQLCMWCEIPLSELYMNQGDGINEDVKYCKLTIQIVGTGQQVKDYENFTYVKTIQLDGLVWHIYKDNRD